VGGVNQASGLIYERPRFIVQFKPR